MIGQDFVVPIGQIFPIQIVQWPEKLTVQIIEGILIFSILKIESKRKQRAKLKDRTRKKNYEKKYRMGLGERDKDTHKQRERENKLIHRAISRLYQKISLLLKKI